MAQEFVNGEDAGFDLAECLDNEYKEWIGAQIRADLYGWVCPGQPRVAASLARQDASLSHRDEGVHAAAFIAALAAAIPSCDDLGAAVDSALREIPGDSVAADAVRFGRSMAGLPDAVTCLHRRYEGLSPVHAINNLALVVWAIHSCGGDFSTAIGDAVSAGWDTDCNGATVGGLCGLMGMTIADRWTIPWNGRVGVGLAGGKVRCEPRLLRAREFPSVARRFRFLDVDGQWQELTVPVSALVFTWCQVPVVYRLRNASRPTLSITWQDGSKQALPQLSLPAELSSELFRRSGRIRQISLDFRQEALFGP
jgi:hypothetical protein